MSGQGSQPPKRSLTPQSSRMEIAKGANEIVVDDFVDSFLTERPRTVPPNLEPSVPTQRGVGLAATETPSDEAPDTARTAPPGPDSISDVQTQRRPESPPSSPLFVPAAPPVSGTAESSRPRPTAPAVKTMQMNAADFSAAARAVVVPRPVLASPSPVAAPVETPVERSMPTMLLPISEPAPLPEPTGGSALTPAPFIQEAVPVGPAQPGAVGSPWAAVEDPALLQALTPRKRSSLPFLLGAGLLTGVCAAGLYVLVLPRLMPAPSASVPSVVAPGLAVVDEPTAGSTPSAATPIASPESSQVAAAETAAVSAQVPPTAAPSGAIAAASPEELAKLLSFQAYLVVDSPADAVVVVQGQDAGRTNERLTVRCGPRNVRLRGSDGRWLSPGQHAQLDCMQESRVSIEAAP